ncbi:MAG: transporter [Bacteroidales bacterium]|nr:transporter [Bacteroidales bacterium]
MALFGKLLTFFKNWALPISMAVGIVAYLVYHFSPSLYSIGPVCRVICEQGQPVFIFLMLFCQFNKVPPSSIRIRRWHLWGLIFQCTGFLLLAAGAYMLEPGNLRIAVETLMICLLCPTATAAGVITDKLGGDLPGTISYCLLINCAFCVLFSLVVPVLHPVEGLSFGACFMRLAMKMFPTLICPCLLAWFIRYTIPPLQRFIAQFKDLAFWLWVVSLSICLVLTTRIIVIGHISFAMVCVLGLCALTACIVQFASGRLAGRRSGLRGSITTGQSLGQKNTGFMIWASYTFLTPQTAVGGGFYCIWHNIVNSYELYLKRKGDGRI